MQVHWPRTENKSGCGPCVPCWHWSCMRHSRQPLRYLRSYFQSRDWRLTRAKIRVTTFSLSSIIQVRWCSHRVWLCCVWCCMSCGGFCGSENQRLFLLSNELYQLYPPMITYLTHVRFTYGTTIHKFITCDILLTNTRPISWSCR